MKIYKAKFFIFGQSCQQGFALAQVIFLIGLTSALSVTIYRVNQQTVNQSKTINQDTSIDLMSRKMLTYLRSSAACRNTTAPLGSWDANTSGTLDRPAGPRGATTALDETLIHPTILLEVRDSTNAVVYEACGTIDTANLENNNRCMVQASGGGNIYLKDIRAINLSPELSPARAELIFNYVTLNSYFDEGTSAYVWEESNIATRALLTIAYDATTNTMTNCSYTEGMELADSCDMIRGDFNDAMLLCKSPSIGFPAFQDGNYGLKVSGNFRTTQRMSAQSMVVGAPIADIPVADQPGNLFVTGGFQYGTTNGGISVGPVANAPGFGMTVAGSIRGSAGIGSTTVGSLELVEPTAAAGNDRRWLVADGQMTLLNFPTTLDLTAPGEANRVVTTGWVRRAIARALATGVSADAIYADLATALRTQQSSIEDNMVERFCEFSRMRSVISPPGSFLTWVNGTNPAIAPARRVCQFAPAFLLADQMCNGTSPASPRCARVYANSVCLGTGADRLCRTSWPTTVNSGECTAAIATTQNFILGVPTTSFTEYKCPDILHRFVNTTTCCRWRAK